MKKLFFALLLSVFFLSNCNEVCEEVCEGSGILNDITDLIAFMDPNLTVDELGTLYVNESHLGEVLSAFQALEIDVDIYEMTIETLSGSFEQFRFGTTFTSSPHLFVSSSGPKEVKSKYKAYVDAQCENVDSAATSECLVKDDGTGYYIIEFLGWDRCVKGTGICVEIEKIIWIDRSYEDSECTILTDVETSKHFDC